MFTGGYIPLSSHSPMLSHCNKPSKITIKPYLPNIFPNINHKSPITKASEVPVAGGFIDKVSFPWVQRHVLTDTDLVLDTDHTALLGGAGGG